MARSPERPRRPPSNEREELRRAQVALQRKKRMVLTALVVALLFLAWILFSPGRHNHSSTKPQPTHSLVVPVRRQSPITIA
jgi:hypothetical protein